MKAVEVHNLEDPQLVEFADNARQEVFNLRFQHATGQLENTARLVQAKKDLARALTVARQRGMKKSMPFEKFRTHTQPVNLRDLEARFDKGSEVTPDSLREKNLATRREVPVKILGQGEISKALTVHAHGFSKTAREKIEAAGGTCQLIEE